MSRCFPYPPPGYSRNGATYEALIESIKLQKESDKAKAKAERKKEKKAKKDKKEKEKRKDEEKVKLPKNPSGSQQDACKVLQSSLGSKEAHNKRTEPNVETLEKSDLTEEHGQPIGAHKPSYSSDSTQNSNKRKRDDAIAPEGSGGHAGKPIKIRLLKKHKGPDSSKETLCSNSRTTDPQSVCGADAKISTWRISTSANTNPPVPSTSNSVIEDRTPFVSGNRNTGVPATSGRENVAVQRNLNQNRTKSTSGSEKSGTKNNDLQGLRFSSKQSPLLPSSGRPILPSNQLKHEIPSSLSNKTALPVPSRTNKSDVDVLHPIRREPIPSHGRSVQPESHLKHEIPPIPTLNVPPPSVSRKNTVEGSYSGRGEQSTPSSGIPIRPTGKRPISEITAPVKEQKAEPTRFEKKLRKKHSKYEKLIGSWVPPVLEVQPPVDDDQDWLSRSEKSGGRSSSRANVETCHESAASMLWQPCARFLAEADIHALPYTVPF